MKRIEPNYGQVVVTLFEEESSHGGIIIPDMGSDKTQLAIIVEEGIGTYNYHTDTIISPKYKKDDLVAIPKIGSQLVVIDGIEYYICQENQVYCKITDL
jgi:co-chaperonin GroES (HSP10)